jgi:hypothetical protein
MYVSLYVVLVCCFVNADELDMRALSCSKSNSFMFLVMYRVEAFA